VLRLFTQLTAEERTNDAKRAELKKLMQEQKARTANQLKEVLSLLAVLVQKYKY
jgi:hypothetical protein